MHLQATNIRDIGLICFHEPYRSVLDYLKLPATWFPACVDKDNNKKIYEHLIVVNLLTNFGTTKNKKNFLNLDSYICLDGSRRICL